MAYCVYADLLKIVPEKVLLQLTDDARTGAVDEDVITEAIDAEADVIDAYIGRIAKLPIDSGSVPPILKRLNARMAIYHLYARVKTPPEHWAKTLESCEKTLGLIRFSSDTMEKY